MKKLKLLTLAASMLASSHSYGECNQMFEEIEPGYCERQERLKAEKEDNSYFNYDYSNNFYNDSFRYPEDGIIDRNGNLNWQPNYKTVSVDLSPGELLLSAGIAASAIIAFNNDQELMDFVQDNKNHFTEEVAFWGEKMGSATIPLAAGGYVLGVVLKDGKIKKTAAMAVKAGLVTGLITRVAKMSFSRKRPNKGEGPYQFAGFDISNDNVSFPSGHTTTAFSFATVIAETYKDKSALIPVLAYSAAAIGGWSRMHDNAHWASDVLVGALIGHLTTKKMMQAENKKKKTKFSRSFETSFYPVFADDYVGIHFSVKPKSKVKDNSSEKFFKKCKEYYAEYEPYENAQRKCMSHFLEASFNK